MNERDQPSCGIPFGPDQRDPCCRGYALFVPADRAPHPSLRYPYDSRLEIQRCDTCARYESDEAAFRAWVNEGSPTLLDAEPLDEVPEDDIEVHELLARLAKKARGLGWDIPKLQDQVFAYFDSIPPEDSEKEPL